MNFRRLRDNDITCGLSNFEDDNFGKFSECRMGGRGGVGEK